MRFMSTRVHGMADYGLGILLILSPYLFGFARGGAAQWIPIIVGVAIIGLSLITDYELSVAKLVPMPVHLAMDGVAGALLLISPCLLYTSDAADE